MNIPEGKLEVSSWGRKHILDYNEVDLTGNRCVVRIEIYNYT